MTTAAARMSGRTRAALWPGVVLAVLLCVSGCSTGRGPALDPSTNPSAGPSSSPSVLPSTPAAESEALQLVPTIWRVVDAADESTDTWIRFDTEVELIRPRGDVELSWSTQGDAILTHVEGWSMTLGTESPMVPWLTSTTRFTRSGEEWVLTDADGRRAARLVRDGLPPPSTQADHSVPTVDEFVRSYHSVAVPGASVRAIDPAAAIGTWGLPGIASTDGSVRLTADGTWSASTSCDVLGVAQGGGGIYRMLPKGMLLVTAGAIAGTGCPAPDQPPPDDARAILDFVEAGSIAVIGSGMIVYDRTGKPLGTLERKD